MNSKRSLLAGLLVALSGGPSALLAGDGKPRAVVVEEVRNDHPAFCVRVDVDHPNHRYRVGDVMHVSVRSSRQGYLYLIHCAADGTLSCLFPNRVQRDNRIPAGKNVLVPAPKARFRLRVAEPTGTEVLKAIVTDRPVTAVDLKTLTRGDATPVTLDQLKAVYVEDLRERPFAWAEHHVEIRTVGRKDELPRSAKRRRVGIFIGIGKYRDEQVRPLVSSRRDAAEMARAMQRFGRLDKAIVLLDEQATLKKIERAVRVQAAELTAPGDTVLLYWSGHGAKCADDNGDEQDGLDEYLIPYDGRFGKLESTRRTMLLDDTFGRWVQGLDGRRLLVVLDTCHSEGLSTQGKGVPPRKADDEPAFDFFADEFARTKDIGQRETALLASSASEQVSFERRDHRLSAMTYCLLERLESAEGKLTVRQAYAYLRKKVPAYVEKHFPGTTQTPVLVDQTTTPILLRP